MCADPDPEVGGICTAHDTGTSPSGNDNGVVPDSGTPESFDRPFIWATKDVEPRRARRDTEDGLPVGGRFPKAFPGAFHGIGAGDLTR
jgi:hypothetical protein